VDDPAFVSEPFNVHTRWIETEWENTVEPYAGGADVVEETGKRETVVVEVGGKRLEVVLPAGLGATTAAGVGRSARKPVRRGGGSSGAAAAGGDALTSPMQGTIVKVAVEEGQQVEAGDLIIVLEAMKMEQPINAHKSGTVSGLAAQVGATVSNGAVLCQIA
jgi:acetyl-CoA/propionyl-CoA carboxylase biotin carboxyl carrier protein